MADKFSWPQAIPWILGIAGLIWNFFNYKRTTALTTGIRKDSIRLDEFKRLRTPIDLILSDLGSQRDAISLLSSSGHEATEVKNQVGDTQKKIVEQYLRLENALARANASQFASGNDWIQCTEVHWDDFLDRIDRAYAADLPIERMRAVLVDASRILGHLIQAVEARIDREMAIYTV